MANRIVIDYYTDLLCVWAWIAQPRQQEMQDQWGDQVFVRHRYLDVFGDAHHKILDKWGRDEGFENFCAHVLESVSAFPEIAVHRDIWQHTRPTSSLPAQLHIKAAELACGEVLAQEYAVELRRAFFVEARDISRADELWQVAAALNLPRTKLSLALDDGSAMAALSRDFSDASKQRIQGSPTWVLDGGRQVLFGNVGYRILHANIEELLNTNARGASWC